MAKITEFHNRHNFFPTFPTEGRQRWCVSVFTDRTNATIYASNDDTYSTGDNNELTSDGTWTYAYDVEGNRISKQNTEKRALYTWDHRNRLTSVTQQEWDSAEQNWQTVQIVEYTYDFNNIWIRKIVGNSKTIFIPENYQTVAQIDDATLSHIYLWMPNAQDKLLADVTPTATLWSLTDHLGTIRDILGATTTHLTYDAFGNLTSSTSNPLLFAYTGKPFDASTQLQNNINRWYDPAVGRWLSVDPIGFEGNDANLYRYVNNIPNTLLDYYGKSKEKNYWRDDFESFGPFSGEYLILSQLETKRQDTLVQKMRDTLDNCSKCVPQGVSAFDNLEKIIETAKHLDNSQIIQGCHAWYFSLYKQIQKLEIPGIIDIDGSAWEYRLSWLGAGHVAAKITICGSSTFYLDNGWWGHIFEKPRNILPIKKTY